VRGAPAIGCVAAYGIALAALARKNQDITRQRAFLDTAFEGLLWGTLPIGSSFLAILLVFLLPERHTVQQEEDEVPFGAEHRYVA